MHKKVMEMNPEGKDGSSPAKVPHNLKIHKEIVVKLTLSIDGSVFFLGGVGVCTVHTCRGETFLIKGASMSKLFN